jgi:hypothetical protein
MKLNEVASEGDLRYWLQEWISECEGRLALEWVEPMMYGSTVGAPDCKVSYNRKTVGLELKYLISTRKGVKWTMRPAQRRYHHMNAKAGGRSALLAYLAAQEKLVIVRGNHIPLRDYASDKESGCAHGLVIMEELNYFSIDSDQQAIFNLENLIFTSDAFWESASDKV